MPHVERAGERERRDETGDLSELLLEAARFYRARLKDAPARDRLPEAARPHRRVAAHFGIGYAPDGWQNLAARVSATTTSPQLDAAGLVIAATAASATTGSATA